MEVYLAKTAGFCMGVSLALKKLDALLAQTTGPARIFTLGPVIHNPQVLAHYAACNVIQADSPEDIPAGAQVVIRAHGIPRQIQQYLQDNNVQLIDATCPKVKKAQLLIAEQTRQGRTLLLYGEANHPEVRGLLSYATADAVVFDSCEEMLTHLDPQRHYFLAAQTTQDIHGYKQLRQAIVNTLATDVPVLETICDATRIRQNEAIAVAQTVENMIVVGGFNSGNTRRLVKVIADQGVACFHVETAEQLDLSTLQGMKKIGLTAGASTPDTLIQQVYTRLASL